MLRGPGRTPVTLSVAEGSKMLRQAQQTWRGLDSRLHGNDALGGVDGLGRWLLGGGARGWERGG